VLTEGRGGAALTFCRNQMTVSAFVDLAASSHPPESGWCLSVEEGCLRPLAALSFLEPQAESVYISLAA